MPSASSDLAVGQRRLELSPSAANSHEESAMLMKQKRDEWDETASLINLSLSLSLSLSSLIDGSRSVAMGKTKCGR